MSIECLSEIVESYRAKTMERIEACVKKGNELLESKNRGGMEDDDIVDFLLNLEVVRMRAIDWWNAKLRLIDAQLKESRQELKEAA